MIYISNNDIDIRIIIDFLNEKGIYANDVKEIAELYHNFCSDEYCANWLILNKDNLEEFYKYLLDKYEKEKYDDDHIIEHLCD